MRLLATLATCLALGGSWLGSAEAKSVTGDRVLVFVPKVDSAKKYSLFLGSLADRGFDVSVRAATNASVSLILDGDRLYDHAIIMSPTSKKLGSGLAVKDFIRFVDAGGNLIVAASSDLSDFHRKLGAQFGVEFEKRGTSAIDHIEHLKEENASDHMAVAARQFAQVPAILSPKVAGKKAQAVYFRGVAHTYSSRNPLLVPVLTGSRTTYSGKPKGENAGAGGADNPLTGKSLGLVSAFQTRGNSRVAFSGSADLFSDELISAKDSGNKQFVQEISQWALQEKSVLRETAHRHYLASTGEQPEHYRVSNEIVYEVDLSVYHDDKWHPYNARDVQFEAIMLDPYIRTTLNQTESADAKTATYRGDIKLPDRYGTFTFRVNYKRTGYSNVDVLDTVGIWPLRHDEYPRFLTAAYPYYAGSLAMVVGFLALCAAWLWNEEPKAKQAAKPKSS